MTMSMNEGESKYFSYDGTDLLVDKETSDVFYNDEKHVYVGKNGISEGRKFTSVTTLVGFYENKFDEEFWKRYKALESLCDPEVFKPIRSKLLDKKKWEDSYIPNGINIDEFNAKCQDFVDQWRETNKIACDYGTKIHAEQENGFYSNAEGMISKYGLGGKFEVTKNYHSLDLEKAIYPEILLNYISEDGELLIAGQSDVVIKEGKHIKVWDFKTNKKLDLKSYYDPKKRKYETMKPPLNNIMDCNYMHYTLQLSIYAWMIQQMHPDYIIDELRIIHFTHEGPVNEYVLDYLKDDVEKLMKHYKVQAKMERYKEDNKPIIF